MNLSFTHTFLKLGLSLIVTVALSLSSLARADNFIVQVMSVKNIEAANHEVDRLLDQGVPSFQRPEDVSGIGLRHRVYLGPFESHEEASVAAKALKDAGVVGEYIVRNDSAPLAAPTGEPIHTAQAQTPPPTVQNQTQTTLPAQNQPPAAQGNQDYWPAPPGPASQGAATNPSQDYWPASPVSPDPTAAGLPASTPVLTPEIPTIVDQNQPPSAGTAYAQMPEVAPVAPGPGQATVVPAKPTADMKIKGFVFLSDLSSSMRHLSACPGGLIKQEAVNTLLRKINHRIPSLPYIAALRVFGYKQSWTRKDYTTLYYGPTTYNRDDMESALGKLFAADSISPFGYALISSEEELSAMENPRALLMFADFEVTADPGQPTDKAKAIIRKYGKDTKIYTYYITRQTNAERLAKDVAQAGNGKYYNVCDLLGDDNAFETMMTEIFGPADLPPCQDSDSDGVCDDRDECPNTPAGAPVDERGCWIAAYSQFFDFDKSEVKTAFHPRLKYAADLITKNPAMGQIIIAGYTDAVGTEKYNMELGLKRAQAVKDLLIQFGAPAQRLEVKSFGKSRPIDTNDTEEGRAKNRRVEFHVGDVPPHRQTTAEASAAAAQQATTSPAHPAAPAAPAPPTR